MPQVNLRRCVGAADLASTVEANIRDIIALLNGNLGDDNLSTSLTFKAEQVIGAASTKGFTAEGDIQTDGHLIGGRDVTADGIQTDALAREIKTLGFFEGGMQVTFADETRIMVIDGEEKSTFKIRVPDGYDPQSVKVICMVRGLQIDWDERVEDDQPPQLEWTVSYGDEEATVEFSGAGCKWDLYSIQYLMTAARYGIR
jgi:hypothetical protein